jgi:hypothetical protein
MFVGEWFNIDGRAIADQEKVWFETDSMDAAVELAANKYSLSLHSKSRYWSLMQDKTRRLVIAKEDS